MTEFSSRVEVQRQLLKIVNDGLRGREELFAMSAQAIRRWGSVNGFGEDSPIVSLLYSASKSIFVMAQHSEEPIAGEYLLSRAQVSAIGDKIRSLMPSQQVTQLGVTEAF